MLLDEVSVISRIMKVEVRVISRSQSLRLITLTETLNVLDITKTERNNCFVLHWTEKMEVMYMLLYWQEATQIYSCVPLGWSGSGSVIQDLSGSWCIKELVNPWPEWICRFLWCTTIQTDLGWLIRIWITPKERNQSAWTWLDYPWPWVSLTWLS